MSEISSINSSFYPSLMDSISPLYAGRSLLNAITPLDEDYEREQTAADLSGYYSNLEVSTLYEQIGQNVVQSAKVLDNAMVAAMANGNNIQDVLNIKLAQTAYSANCFVMKSTLELDI